MKNLFLFSIFLITTGILKAQSVSPKDPPPLAGVVTVFKDNRLDLLAKKEAEFNEAMAASPKTARGYRLMIMSTNNRALAMNLRARLLQRFPEQKVYMSFQPPFIKLKFGNFLEKVEADQYKKEIINNKMVSTNIYLIPETIEIKPDKNS